MKKHLLFVICLTVLMTGCINKINKPLVSSHLDYHSQPGFTPPLASENSAVVVFLRPKKVHLFHAVILDGDKFVTLLTDNSHFIYTATPGIHRFMGDFAIGQHTSYVNADLAAGKIYFIAVKWLESGLRGWWQMIPITPNGEDWDDLRRWLDISVFAELNASGKNWFMQHRAELLMKQQDSLIESRITNITSSEGVDKAP